MNWSYKKYLNFWKTLFVLICVGCSHAPVQSSNSKPTGKGGIDGAGFPNPTGDYCKSVQGVPINLSKGISLCNVGGALIEQWTLYRFKMPTIKRNSTAIQSFLSDEERHIDIGNGGANPSSQYCIQKGGTINILTDRAGNQTGICHFEDQSGIEEWTLFRGPNDPKNADLKKLLTEP
jgi:putative hemolysin